MYLQWLILNDRQDQGDGTHDPAVVRKKAELALVGDHFQQADTGVTHGGGHRHAHQICRHLRPHYGVEGVLDAEDIGTQDGGVIK